MFAENIAQTLVVMKASGLRTLALVFDKQELYELYQLFCMCFSKSLTAKHSVLAQQRASTQLGLVLARDLSDEFFPGMSTERCIRW